MTDIAQRAADIAAKAKSEKAAKGANIARDYPEFYAIVVEYRNVFGRVGNMKIEDFVTGFRYP